jgi:hypothetical protein
LTEVAAADVGTVEGAVVVDMDAAAGFGFDADAVVDDSLEA